MMSTSLPSAAKEHDSSDKSDEPSTSDWLRLNAEVRALRRLVYVLSASAMLLGIGAGASCARKEAPAAEVRFVDGSNSVAINASGVHIANGKAHVDISTDRIVAPEMVVGDMPNVTIKPSQLTLSANGVLVTLSATPDLGARLELTSSGGSSLAASAKAHQADLQMETSAGRFVHAIAADDVSAVDVEQPRMRGTLTTDGDDACMSVRHDRPGAESRPKDVVEFCSSRSKE